METLNIFLAAAVALFGGFASGYFVGWIAKEELKAGRKYFVWLERIILLAIAVVLLSSFVFGSTAGIFLLIAALVFLYGFPAGSLLYLRKL
jgi:uncharacterized membrane protein